MIAAREQLRRSTPDEKAAWELVCGSLLTLVHQRTQEGRGYIDLRTMGNPPIIIEGDQEPTVEEIDSDDDVSLRS